LTAKKKIIWHIAETQVSKCNRYEGESNTHDFVIMELDIDSYVGYKEKENDDYIIIKADQKDVEIFIKIMKATRIKEKVKERVLV
jgi:hypothetical protein